MRKINVIITALVLVFGTAASRAVNLDRISAETGVPVATLQAERTSTGLGWGGLEKAHLLANETGQSFDDIVALHQAGEGWGKIARDNGLNLGRIVSDAHRSSQAASHAQNTQTIHGKSSSIHGKSSSIHGKSTSSHGKGHASAGKSVGFTSKSVGHGPSFKSGRGGGMGHGHGGH